MKKMNVKIVAIAAAAMMMAACTGCGNSTDVAADTTAETPVTEIDVDDNPGSFENDNWSVSYDTSKFFGYSLDDAAEDVVINCTEESIAGTTLIEITQSDCTTADDAIKEIADKTGQELADAEETTVNGYTAYKTQHVIPDDSEGVIIDDYYIVFENNGKVTVVDECITRNPDADSAEAVSADLDEVISTITFK